MGVTPPEACIVPTRFVVLAVPVFKAQKLTVTVSPGSITALLGTQPSAVSVAVPAVMIGLGVGLGVAVGVGLQQEGCETEKLSTLQPTAATLLSDPMRNLSLQGRPAAPAGKFAVLVINPPVDPVQAFRLARGLPKAPLMVPV